MPSVWFINPRIVANLKALATRNRGGGGSKKTDEKGEEGQKGEKDEEGEGGGRRGG